MAGLISSQLAPIEQPGIEVGTCRERKAGQRSSKGIKTQFQRGGFYCTLPMVSLPLRSGQNEHRQHVLIGRPAFGGLAPAQEAFQAQTHQSFLIKLRCKEEQTIPLVQRAFLLLRANTQSEHTVSKEAHILLTIQ